MLLCLRCFWRGQLGIAPRAQAQMLSWVLGEPGSQCPHLWRVGILLANLEGPFLHQESIFLWCPSLGTKLPITIQQLRVLTPWPMSPLMTRRARILIQVHLTQSFCTSSWVWKREELKQRPKDIPLPNQIGATQLGPLTLKPRSSDWELAWACYALLWSMSEVLCSARFFTLIPE